MKNFVLLKWFGDVPIARKLYFTVGIMALLIGVELFALTFSIGTLSSVRAYVGGEGLWSKAEKDAVYQLLRYGNTRSETDYNQFKEFMKVIDGDGKARVQLKKAVPDFDKAREGFKEGRNSPSDIDGMINLFRRFHSISYINKAISIWDEAEPLAFQLSPIGERLHAEINAPSPSQENINQLLKEIDPLNKKLTVLEDDFSFTLGEGSRWLENLVLKLLFSIALSVEITGLLLAISVSRNIQKGLSEIITAARAFANGSFKARAKVFSKDEIGVLASSFNKMSDQLENNFTELEQAQKKFRGLLEAAPDAMIIMDKQGFIELVNSQAEKLFQYSREQLLGQSVRAILPDWNNINTSNPGNLQLTGRKNNNVTFPSEISFSPLQTEEGLLVFAAVRDITERKNAEDAIKTLNESLEQKVLERTAQLKEANLGLESFSYSVSHDLRTPLRSINGFCKILLKSHSEHLDAQGKELLEVISENASRMGLLIDGLLKLARVDREAVLITSVDLNKLLNEVIEELKQVDNNLTAEIRLHDLKPAECDPVLLKQVWTNLVSNAVKYSRKVEKPVVEIGSKASNGRIVYYVKDNGAGFDMKYYEQLFGAFKRLHDDNEFEGNGVGLALVARIINRHGGKIWAEAETNKGATFYFFLSNKPATALS